MSRIGFLRDEWLKFGQQMAKKVLQIISTVVDESFNSLNHFVDVQNVLKQVSQ